jgi:hypothetical protein
MRLRQMLDSVLVKEDGSDRVKMRKCDGAKMRKLPNYQIILTF